MACRLALTLGHNLATHVDHGFTFRRSQGFRIGIDAYSMAALDVVAEDAR